MAPSKPHLNECEMLKGTHQPSTLSINFSRACKGQISSGWILNTYLLSLLHYLLSYVETNTKALPSVSKWIVNC